MAHSDPPCAPVDDPGRWRHRTRASAICAVAVAAIFVLSLGRRVERTDEAWFLWVADRLGRGLTLYRDVYSVTTPLAHWVTTLAVEVTGAQIATVRLLETVAFVAIAELSRRLVARSGVGIGGQAAVLAVLYVTVSPPAHFVALYSSLAVALALGAWVVATSPSFPARARWITAGLCCGAAFLSKPNVGATALAATVVCAVVATRGGSRRATGAATIRLVVPFAVVLGAGVAAIAATGSWSAFVGEVFLDKGGYLVARTSYLSQVTAWLRSFTRWHSVDTPVRLGVALVPLLAAVAVVAALVRAQRPRVAALPALAFMVVGVVALVPRPTPTHLAAATPFLLVGSVVTWKVVGAPSWPRPARVLVGVVSAVAAVALAYSAIQGLPTPRSTLPHMAWTPAAPHEARLRRELARLRRASGGTVFIVQSDAGFWYLTGDLRDPTRFDIPEKTDFGPHDQQTAVAAIEADPPRYVCLRREQSKPLALEAEALERFLRRRSVPRAGSPICDLRTMTAHPASATPPQAPVAVARRGAVSRR